MTGRLINVRPKPGFQMDTAGNISPAGSGFPMLSMMLGDRLANVMTGMGTSIDRRTYAGYNFMQVDQAQVEASYRGSWLMRKIIDLPPLDMTRAWRSWQAESDAIEQIEALERKLQVKHKCKRALTLARLWGGAALVMGIAGNTDPEQPLEPANVGKDQLSWLHLFARHQISTGEMETDPASPWFGQPKSYRLTPRGGAQINIHPSRVIPFVGQPVPEGSNMVTDWFWGDPLYQSILSALQNADLSQEGFAALIDEAKHDIIKIPDLMANARTQEYEDRLLARLQLAATGKSTWRAMILDGAEDWQQRQVVWNGMPDIITIYLQIVAGAADIPITRLLGQSPKGLQSTGDGEEKDYHAMIEARQDELLVPALDRLDQVLIPSALGSRPSDIWYKFNPLMRLSPKDAADIEAKRAETVKKYSDTGLLDPDALSQIAMNAMNESGQWPGSEAAFEDADAQGGDDDDLDEAELMLPEEIEAADRRRPRRIMDARLEDARPRTLYVSRRLINGDELIRWAKAQGFETTQPAKALHVTIAFSRERVDWMKVGDDWSSDEDGRIRVKPGGPRTVERLGEKGAVVLMFRNDALEWRHRRIHEEGTGAKWDWPEYQPHITITWEAPADLDLDAIEPYQGPLVFGPEIFAEVVEDWEKSIKEE